MQTIHFNTQRSYTAHGQRITATLHDDGVVTFWDHDRMVHGEFTLADHYPFACGIDARTVTAVYDLGLCRGTSRAWADGMNPGGCNTAYQG